MPWARGLLTLQRYTAERIHHLQAASVARSPALLSEPLANAALSQASGSGFKRPAAAGLLPSHHPNLGRCRQLLECSHLAAHAGALPSSGASLAPFGASISERGEQTKHENGVPTNIALWISQTGTHLPSPFRRLPLLSVRRRRSSLNHTPAPWICYGPAFRVLCCVPSLLSRTTRRSLGHSRLTRQFFGCPKS